MSDLMRRMRDHVGYDPAQVLAHPERYNRAERRAAKRVLAEGTGQPTNHESDHENVAGQG